MLQEGNYTVLELYPPAQGMNRLIAPEALPQGFASALENILPTPLGSATVRYGTRRRDGMTLEADASLIEAFPFALPNGNKQAVLYVQTFVLDTAAQNFVVLSPQSFQFDTRNATAFNADTPLKIEYTKRGDTTLYSSLVSKTVLGQTVTLTVENNSFPFPIDGVVIDRVSFSEGSLYVYDFQVPRLGPVLKTGLSAACVPRSVTFLNKLLICNGVDKVLVWDGQTLSELVDFVKEDTATDFQRIDTNRFSFSLSPLQALSFDITKYANNNQIQLSSQGAITTTTVAQITRAETLADTLVTITTTDVLPAFVNPVSLFYRDWPPAFSFMRVAHNRLWALGPGAVGLNYRDPDQALRVYFSYQSGTVDGWFNENTKTVPSINLARGHGSPDNLEAIAFISGLMVFMGRTNTQVWVGSEPLGGNVDPTKPKFEFSSLLPIGIVQGNLIAEMANDLYFVSQNGILSFSTLNVAKQFAATSSESVDPLVRQYVSSTTESNHAYRACRSFKYQSGAFCGFKIGLNKVLISLYSANLYAWTVFSGDFAKAQTFLSDGDNTLYLGVGNQLYQYADGSGDGSDSPPVYGDNDGKDLIPFLWTPPLICLPGRRFANKRYEIICDYSSSFILHNENNVSLMISGDSSKTFRLQDAYTFQFKGDSLGTAAFVTPGDIGNNPNDPDAEALGFRLDEPYAFLKGRLKFLSSSFTVSLIGSTLSGPLVFKKIRLFGIAERS